jgi:Raf kinase inhibitor-like YbhB/YbcL family protein
VRFLFKVVMFSSLVVPVVAQQVAPAAPAAASGPGFSLSSTSFEDGGLLGDKYSQKVTAWVSPELEWKNVPAGAVSYALLVHDQDVAPRKGVMDITHWMAFNIPGTTMALPEGFGTATATLPDGTVQGKNARGTPGFLGPGAGAAGPYHHYAFELYALDTKLTLTPESTRAELLAAMEGHIVGKAVTSVRFHK